MKSPLSIVFIIISRRWLILVGLEEQTSRTFYTIAGIEPSRIILSFDIGKKDA